MTIKQRIIHFFVHDWKYYPITRYGQYRVCNHCLVRDYRVIMNEVDK